MIDQQSFPELVNPWQPISNPTAPPPSRMKKLGKLKKQVSYADAVTVSSNQSTALTSATTTVTNALETKVQQLEKQLTDQADQSKSLRQELSSLKATVTEQAAQLTTVNQAQETITNNQTEMQQQIATIHRTQTEQIAHQHQVSTALDRIFHRLDSVVSQQQFEQLTSLLQRQQIQSNIPAPTPSPQQNTGDTAAPPSLATNTTALATADTPARPSSRPREATTSDDPETNSPPHKRTCPPALSPDTQFALENSSPIHVPDEAPAMPQASNQPPAPTALFPSAPAPQAPSQVSPTPVSASANADPNSSSTQDPTTASTTPPPAPPTRILALRNDIAREVPNQSRPSNAIINPYASHRFSSQSNPRIQSNRDRADNTPNGHSTSQTGPTGPNSDPRPPAAPNPQSNRP